jgi:hypothetical protein
VSPRGRETLTFLTARTVTAGSNFLTAQHLIQVDWHLVMLL